MLILAAQSLILLEKREHSVMMGLDVVVARLWKRCRDRTMESELK